MTDGTIIGFLGDESGSMSGNQRAMVDGFNQFVGNIRKDAESKDVRIMCGFFDAHGGGEGILRMKLDKQLDECPELSLEDYNPRGGTPLNDATVEMIGNMGHHRSNGEKMMLVIFTDGLENSSVENNADDVRKLIRSKEADGWEFIYLGANQDAWDEGAQRGIAKNRSYNVMATEAGVSATMDSVSSLATSRTKLADDEYKTLADEHHRKTGGEIKEKS